MEDHIITTTTSQKVKCSTTKGNITMEYYRNWSPNGYDRVMELFQQHYYDSSHFFRVVSNFLVQFGITYNETLKEYATKTIFDDPLIPIPFTKGIISYAGGGPNSRTTQLFIAFQSGHFGENVWETPVGRIVDGVDVIDSLYHGYGDMPPWGKGPVQNRIHDGPEYIEQEFPLLDKFISCTILGKDDDDPPKKEPNEKGEEQQQVVGPPVIPDLSSKKLDEHRSQKQMELVPDIVHSNKDGTPPTTTTTTTRSSLLRKKSRHHNNNDNHPNKQNNNNRHQRSVMDRQHHHVDPHIIHPGGGGGSNSHRSMGNGPHVQHHQYYSNGTIMQQPQQQHHGGHVKHEMKTFKEAGPIQEGVTTFSWELLSVCLFLFLGVLALWLKFVFCNHTNGKRKRNKAQ